MHRIRPDPTTISITATTIARAAAAAEARGLLPCKRNKFECHIPESHAGWRLPSDRSFVQRDLLDRLQERVWCCASKVLQVDRRSSNVGSSRDFRKVLKGATTYPTTDATIATPFAAITIAAITIAA